MTQTKAFIYLFRGAEPTLFNNLDDYIPNLKTIFMRMNYRSSDEIVQISNKVIEMNKNRIKKICVSNAGPKSHVELIFGSSNSPLDEKEFDKIQKLLSQGVKPDEIAVLYRSSNDNTTYSLQKRLSVANIPFVSTFVNKDIYYDIVYNLCRYHYSKDETFLVNAAQYFEGNSNFGSDTLIDLSEFEKVNLNLNSIFTFFDKLKQGYKKNGEPKADYARFLAKVSDIQESIQRSLDDWESLSDDEKKEACKVDMLLGDNEPLEGKGVKIMTMHKSKGLEFPYVFVNGLSKGVMDKAQDNAEVNEEKARLAYVAYSRAKLQLYLGCDDIHDMHGVLGQVCDMPYVDLENSNLKPELEDEKKKSISDYENILDVKTETVYYKLIYNGELKGYRCTYSLHGEKFAFHARISDLERLNCVPKRLAFMVKVGRDIQVVKYENEHCYAFDELNDSIRVIDLIRDLDIKAVFLGSNNGYNKDIKDKLELDNIVREELKKRDKIKSLPNKEVVKSELNKNMPNKETLKTEVPNNISTKEVLKSEVSKEESNKGFNKDNYHYIMLVSQNTGKVLGVRIVNKDNKYKDISIEEAKKLGVTPKDCKEKKFIPIISEYDYQGFININNRNKKQNIVLKYKILEISFSDNKCKVLNTALDNEEVHFIDDIVQALKQGQIYLSNPSLLTNWKYWKK